MDAVQQKEIANKAIENLRKRLLDLTARNRLINFRHTKGASLRIIGEPLDPLVEILLTEKELRFLPVPEPTKEKLIEAGYISIEKETGQEIRLKKSPSAEEWARWLGFDTSYEIPFLSSEEYEHKNKAWALQTLLFPYELETRLRSIRHKSNSAIEETGANILYIAIGFLEWFDNNNSDNKRIAPLFLVPAQLKRGRLNRKFGTYEYTLSYSGEEILTNLSLREKLRVDFGLALPELDENTRPESYLEAVQKLIRKNQPQWRLRRFITLTLLNFKKLLMYLDLDPERWPVGKRITDHPIVSQFLASYTEKKESDEIEPDLGFGEEYEIDELPDVHKNYPLIDDADSSQHSALVDAVDGKNLVIEGPPGTGKSQTITNLIAASMARGKRVLFVAEKLAALEVVKRRLNLAGLGEFCMELHSHKTQKQKVIDDIGQRIDKHGRYRNPMQINEDIVRYEELKKTLKNYAELINRYWKQTRKTLHEIFMSATRYREELSINPETLHPDGYDGNTFDPTTQRRTRDQVFAYFDLYKVIVAQLDGKVSVNNHPWFGVRNSDLQMFDIDQVQEVLGEWQKYLKLLEKFGTELSANLHCDESKIPKNMSGLERLLVNLNNLPKLVGDEVLECLPILRGEKLEKFKKYLYLFEGIQRVFAKLAKKIPSEVLNDLSKTDIFLRGGKRLLQIVNKDIELGRLDTAIKCVKQILSKLEEIQKPVLKIQSIIDQRAKNHLKLSESGIRELIEFVRIVADLPPAYWKLRNNLFDNDELDQVLPEIRREIVQLNEMWDELEGVYERIGFPNSQVLQDLKSTISEGGTFRWLKGSWRSSRKSLMLYSANTQVKFKEMMALLDKAIAFADARNRFENNLSYRELLVDHMKGIDTDINSLETIRSWYRRVRQIYGYGFGPKVEVGDSIIDLPIELARMIRSLAERGVIRELSSVLDELPNLKTIFAPVQQIQNEHDLLTGKNGILVRILSSLRSALKDCEQLLTDNKITISEIIRNIKAISTLRNYVNIWEKANYDNLWFDGKLDLQIGLDTNYQVSLAKAYHTITVASYLDDENISPLIRNRIFDAPNRSTFKALYLLGEKLRSIVEKQTEKRIAFDSLVKIDTKSWTNTCGDSIGKLIDRNAHALSNEKTLQNWLDYIRVREHLSLLGFNNLADKVEAGELPINKVKDAYYAGIYDLLAREIIRELPELGRFSGHAQETLQRQFKEYDDRLKSLQCERISWQVDQVKLPRGNCSGRVSEYTELYLIEHEKGKKKRHLPIRQLLKRAGSAMVALKPCFMMGPISVAQYLEPGQIEFDVVVMDEASQIKPEDSLGAIARGSQLVVVGDPKQLPPTSFFERAIDDEEEDFTAIEESESILDATIPIFSARRLRWHYRSQHESLIAFSNTFFYNSDLILFPSPLKISEDHGIKYYRIKRGSFVNRRNLEEARVISEAVREHFRQGNDESIGVVAMSAEQRDQIERSIEMLAKEDSAFQTWLEKDQSKHESLFIKNLENVQGDERDVIFISMTYGPMEVGGKVFQRFGPINSDVGWRRLNVLFTRSRKRMHVFSSMGSEDILVESNSRRGVKALRDFISYCELGIFNLNKKNTERSADSDFEIAVAKALQNVGFECDFQVGVAGFFIDIAVIDPGKPGRYLMGIECDGATYHSAKSVRDRDRLRQEILERLGWIIRRIWSTDWFKNPQAELSPIIRELQQLKTKVTPEIEIQVEKETDEIEDIKEEGTELAEIVDQFTTREIGLEEKLIRFDTEVIRRALPHTPDNQRLLRPAMIEAFLEYMPTSKTEFLEYIPYYLRQSIKSGEGKFLNSILEIINSTLCDNSPIEKVH